jgi:membrane-associated phospholipid phosphatase
MPSPRFFFGVSAAAGVFSLFWTWLTMYQGSTQAFDDRCVEYWFEWTKENRGLTTMMIFWTDMGGIAANTLIAFLGAIWQSAIGNRIIAVAWLGIAIGGGIINMSTKEYFERERPPATKRASVVHEENASYPSGHAMGSTIGYGMIAYAFVLPQCRRRRRVIGILLMVAIVLLVGFSRIYLRAHWFSDVVAGWSIGVCWLFFCLGWLERHRRRQFQPPTS